MGNRVRESTEPRAWFEAIGASGFAILGATLGLQIAVGILIKTTPGRFASVGELIRSLLPASPPAKATPGPMPVKAAQAIVAPRIPPQPKFDPRDIEATWHWLIERRRELGTEYEAARKATINPLVVEPMQRFAESLKRYDQRLGLLVGERVVWPARVTSISEDGVRVDCGASGYVNPGETSRSSPQFKMDVFISLQEEHFLPVGHGDHAKEQNLQLDREIPISLARKLQPGDYIFIYGEIEVIQLRRIVESDTPGPPDSVEIFLGDVSAGAVNP